MAGRRVIAPSSAAEASATLLRRVDWTRSEQLARAIAAGFGADVCWEAAIVALLLLGHPAGAHYVEGFLIPPDTDLPDDALPIAHGWAELADGTILDPHQAAIRAALRGRPEPSYLAARRYLLEDVLSAQRRRAKFPLMYHGRARSDDPQILAVRAEALRQTLAARAAWRAGA
jgi:hypothetical protein